MESLVIDKVDEKIKEILDSGITVNNIDNLYKLSKIKHMAKEDKNMYYNGRGPGVVIDGILYDTADCSSHRIWCVWEIKD